MNGASGALFWTSIQHNGSGVRPLLYFQFTIREIGDWCGVWTIINLVIMTWGWGQYNILNVSLHKNEVPDILRQ